MIITGIYYKNLSVESIKKIIFYSYKPNVPKNYFLHKLLFSFGILQLFFVFKPDSIINQKFYSIILNDYLIQNL